jgi:hypothetical protein
MGLDELQKLWPGAPAFVVGIVAYCAPRGHPVGGVLGQMVCIPDQTKDGVAYYRYDQQGLQARSLHRYLPTLLYDSG